MSLFTLFDHFFTLHLFLGATSKGWKESIGFPDSELYTESFEKKFINKMKYSRSSPDPDFLDLTISSHQQQYDFFLVFADFWTLAELREIKIGRLEAEELAVWGEGFQLSQKERFLKPIKKVLILLFSWELVPATMSIALFWQSQRFMYFIFVILLQFCY